MDGSEVNLAGLPDERQPVQDRSRASLTRMLDAARHLLVTNGSADFSLGDVSRTGHVSIGSIYHRFEGKDELLRAVHRELMQELRQEQLDLVSRAQLQSGSLPELLANLVDGIAEFLRAKAGVLRPMMLCANKDAAIGGAGAAGHYHLSRLFVQAVLLYAGEIKRADPHHAVVTCFNLTYAAIGHELGFGATHRPREAQDWQKLKMDLVEMCAAFLMSAPLAIRPVKRGKAKKQVRAPSTQR